MAAVRHRGLPPLLLAVLAHPAGVAALAAAVAAVPQVAALMMLGRPARIDGGPSCA